MRAWIWPGVLLLAATACHTRSVPAADGAGDLRTDAVPSDSLLTADAAPHTCKQLVALGSTQVGPNTGYSARPSVAHDGSQFGVAWHHGKSFSNGTPGAPVTLRFTRVDSAGKAQSPEGVKVGDATSDVQPALAYGGGQYAVLYRGASLSGLSGQTVLDRLRPDGTSKQRVSVTAAPRSVALTWSGGGHAALVAEKGASNDTLVLATVDTKGAVTRKVVQSGGSYWLPWIAPRAGGYVAAWGGSFARLSATGSLQQVTMIKSGMSPVYSPSSVGYAVAYLDFHGTPPKENVLFQLLDPSGKALGQPRGAGQNADYGAMIARYIAMVWTGGMHVVVYSRWSTTGSALVAQLLDHKGATVGTPVPLPLCTPKPLFVNLAAAWGNGSLAVAASGGYSSGKGARLCVSRIRCLP